MSNISLFNKGGAIMTVIAHGKATKWFPQTIQTFFEEEAQKLLKYEYIVREGELYGASSSSILLERNKELEALRAENAALKASKENITEKSVVDESSLDREALKAKAAALNIEFARNIKTTDLAKLVEGK